MKHLAVKIWQDWEPDVVAGIAKGGVIPAVFLSSAFRLDFFPNKLSSRHHEEVIHEQPEWYVRPTEAVRERRVLLVDDISGAGRTMDMAREERESCGAREVRTATLAVHTGSIRPDYTVLETDALVIWPWDRETIAADGTEELNPEYRAEAQAMDTAVRRPDEHRGRP